MQLRDSQTSELIAEGTPLEIAILAADLDPADILFDGAGACNESGRSLFDPAAVRTMRGDELVGLQAALDEAQKAPDTPEIKQRRQDLRDTIKERRDRIAAGKAKTAGAKQAMGEARDRVEKRRRG